MTNEEMEAGSSSGSGKTDARRSLKRGPFYATAIDEGLSGWLILLKDLLKSVLYCLDDVRTMRARIGLLLAYDESENAGTSRLFGDLYSILAQCIAELRALRQSLRDELVTLELVLLPGVLYRDLAEAFDKKPGVVLPRPESEDGLPRQYAAALRVLLYTGLSQIHEIIGQGQSTQSEPIIWLAKLFEEVDKNPQQKKRWLKLVLQFQDQPYCQPERIERWLERRSNTNETDLWGAFDEQFRNWLEITSKDGRSRDLGNAVREIVGASGMTGSLPEFLQAFKSNNLQKSESTRERKALVMLVVAIGERCWTTRRDTILKNVAQYRSGDVPDVDRAVLNQIHADMFARTETYRIELERTISVVRTLAQAIPQRAALLAPNVPNLGRLHRHADSHYESALLSLMQHIKARTQETMGRLLADLPELVVDMAFDHAVVSRVCAIDESNKVRSIMITLPFFWRHSPRYMANVAHEVAHAYLQASQIDSLFCGAAQWPKQRKKWSEPKVADHLRVAGAKLAELWQTNGVTQPFSSLIAEVLADFFALLVIGPHYVFALAFAIIFDAGTPSSPDRSNSTEINPFVRFGALLQAIQSLWPELFKEPASGSWEIGYWRQDRLLPLISICQAYFRILDQPAYELGYESYRTDLFKAEIEILGECLRGIIAVCGSSKLTSFQVISYESHSKPFEVAVEVGNELDRFLKQVQAVPDDPAEKAATSISRKFVNIAAKSDANTFRAELIRDNMLHFLWNSILKRYPEVVEEIEALAPDQSEDEARNARRRAIERALWVRVPEVRLITRLEDLIHKREQPSEPTARSVCGERTIQPGDVISVTQIDCDWSRALEPHDPNTSPMMEAWKEWEKERAPEELAAWVIGAYDFQFIQRHFAGAERLDRSGASILGLLPAKPRYSSFQLLDYVVSDREPNSESSPKKSTARGPLGAFLQLRFGPIIPRAEELFEGMTFDGIQFEAPILISRGWEHYAVLLNVETIDDLATFCHDLRCKYPPPEKGTTKEQDQETKAQMKPSLHDLTLHLLYRPGDTQPNQQTSGKKGKKPPRVLVGFVSRFRGHASGALLEAPLERLQTELERKARENARVNELRTIVSLHSTTGDDTLELYVEFRTSEGSARKEGADRDKLSRQCKASLVVYQELMAMVARHCEAFDVRTTVLLPFPHASKQRS